MMKILILGPRHSHIYQSRAASLLKTFFFDHFFPPPSRGNPAAAYVDIASLCRCDYIQRRRRRQQKEKGTKKKRKRFFRCSRADADKKGEKKNVSMTRQKPLIQSLMARIWLLAGSLEGSGPLQSMQQQAGLIIILMTSASR